MENIHNDVGVHRVKVFGSKKRYLIKEITENQAFTRLVFVKMSSLYEKTNKQQTQPRPMQFAIFGVFSAFFLFQIVFSSSLDLF